MEAFFPKSSRSAVTGPHPCPLCERHCVFEGGFPINIGRRLQDCARCGSLFAAPKDQAALLAVIKDHLV